MSQQMQEAKFVPPRDSAEEILAAIWLSLLDVEEVGIYDNFFGLGGHSLLATQVISRVRESFSIDLSLNSLFESPTIAGLRKHIEVARFENRNLPFVPIQPVARDRPIPLSFAQQQFWFLDQLAAGFYTYNTFTGLHLMGQIDVVILKKTLDEIVRRHEILRTTFPTTVDEPVQIIAPPAPLPLPLIDLKGLPEEVREGEGRRLAVQEANYPFDL
jgi:acyl carrier protein